MLNAFEAMAIMANVRFGSTDTPERSNYYVKLAEVDAEFKKYLEKEYGQHLYRAILDRVWYRSQVAGRNEDSSSNPYASIENRYIDFADFAEEMLDEMK